MFTVCILESAATGRWYYGATARLEQRLAEHNGRHGHFTGGRGPWRLVFVRRFEEKAAAMRFERLLKSLRNPAYVRRQYAEWFL